MHGRRTRRQLIAVMAVCAALASCSGSSDAQKPTSSTVTPVGSTASGSSDTPSAVFPGKTWKVEKPATQGMDAATLEKARTYAFQKGKNTQGVVVVHNGVIVSEWYAPGSNKDSWEASWSMAKSFTSALIGIAIHEGKIPGVDVKMTTYYPDWAQRGLGDVTLRDVLEMSSGLKWNEDYSPDNLDASNVVQMVLTQRDELAYAAARPRDVAPHTVFNYTSGGSMLLSGVLAKATGMSAEAYARTKLLNPIEMSKVDWWSDAEGHTLTYCCVDTTSRDFARFGLLYLNKGNWNGKQVVPARWVADSVKGSRVEPETYGYQWWLEDVDGVPHDLFQAEGHDGQFIYVVPSLNLVVVRNGTYVKNAGTPIADPNLFAKYPSGDIVPGQGTAPPDSWDSAKFLGPIVASMHND